MAHEARGAVILGRMTLRPRIDYGQRQIGEVLGVAGG